MRSHLLGLLGICGLFLSLSCQKEPVLSLTGLTNIELDADGGSEIITFQTNRNWTVSWSEPWITVTPSSGAASNGSITLNVRADANRNITRSGTITINAGGLSQTISVKQQAGDLLIGTWGLVHLLYYHKYKGEERDRMEYDANPFAPSSENDIRIVIEPVSNNTYTYTNYYWDVNKSMWSLEGTRHITRHNNILLFTDPLPENTYGSADAVILTLTSETLVIESYAKGIPNLGDEYYEKGAFTRILSN